VTEAEWLAASPTDGIPQPHSAANWLLPTSVIRLPLRGYYGWETDLLVPRE
jgi:hypothetical protein